MSRWCIQHLSQWCVRFSKLLVFLLFYFQMSRYPIRVLEKLVWCQREAISPWSVILFVKQNCNLQLIVGMQKIFSWRNPGLKMVRMSMMIVQIIIMNYSLHSIGRFVLRYLSAVQLVLRWIDWYWMKNLIYYILTAK